MPTNPKTLMFSMTLIMGTIISTSATSWYGAWLGLEINLLSFIPMILNSHNQQATEASIKYFLSQAFASMLLLLFIALMAPLNSYLMNNPALSSLMLTSLSIKLGAAPTHFWVPEVMEGMNWNNCLILMTWQKLAPLTLMSYNTYPGFLLPLIVILSSIAGAIGGFNQTSTRKIMAFSSISHMGWLLATLTQNDTTWFLYFILYSVVTSATVSLFNFNKSYQLNQTFTNNSPLTLKLLTSMSMLSLGGLPPLMGFLPKWMVIMKLSNSTHFILLVIMIPMVLITLFYYMRITYSSILLETHHPSWTYHPLPNKTRQLIWTTLLSLMGLLLIPIFINPIL